ncbi:MULTISPECIES: LysR family transcriptional regulator [Roseomonadaceae]|uniref:LysR family transcriptional regulator n=1 Tax=Falsiroseomonas oleicola TaxID=2801474 RepID=A0ABS6H3Z8_9PROT|nr:LysR family transcriptional regulator [Roseomonas oleicola]MBU8542140.1 LysR family transcriptional regulator [Roseomonas oleicola]
MTTPGHLDWSLLQAFVAVMRDGSLSAAALKLRLTQPTVGRQIRALEEAVGEALFDRTPQGLRPTDRATALFDHAAALEQAAQALGTAMGGKLDSPTGTVRITTSESFGVERLPGLLQPFMEANPGITIEMLASTQVENLLRRDADIAIRFARPEQPDLVARQVGTMELGFFAAESYLTRYGVPETLAELRNHRMVGFDRDPFARRAAERLALPVETWRAVYRSDSMIGQHTAVRAGLGIGVMHAHRDAPAQGLRRLLTAEFAPKQPIWLVAHADVRQGRRFRAVFDHLAAVLPAEFGGR